MNNILLSIIIPAFNAEKSIERCVRSLLLLERLDYEVIIVDDGSTDSTSKICMSLASNNSKVKYFYQNNSGVSSARNLGLSNSKGDYIGFLDSDDFFCEGSLLKLLNEVEHQLYDVYYFGYIYKSEKSNKIRLPYKSKECNFLNLLYYFDECATHKKEVNRHIWGWIVRSKIYKNNNIKFDHHLTMGEDFDVCLEVAKNSKSIRIIPYALYSYEYNENSVTKVTKSHLVLSELKVADKWLKELDNFTGLESLRIYLSNFFCCSVSRIPRIIDEKTEVIDYVNLHLSDTRYTKRFKFRIAKIVWDFFGYDTKILQNIDRFI